MSDVIETRFEALLGELRQARPKAPPALRMRVRGLAAVRSRRVHTSPVRVAAVGAAAALAIAAIAVLEVGLPVSDQGDVSARRQPVVEQPRGERRRAAPKREQAAPQERGRRTKPEQRSESPAKRSPAPVQNAETHPPTRPEAARDPAPRAREPRPSPARPRPTPVGVAPPATPPSPPAPPPATAAPVAGAAADLSVQVTDGPDPAAVGATVTYAIVVTNAGPGEASAVVTKLSLGPGVEFLAAGASQGRCSGTAPVTCALGAIVNGGSASVRIAARPTEVGETTASAVVEAATADPDPTDNTARATTTVAEAAPPPPSGPPPPPAPPRPITPPPPGPPPTVPGLPVGGCTVPNVVGKALAAAKSAIRGAGCTTGQVVRRRSTKPRGRVVSQRPRAGSRLAAGASVRLVFSS